jgi:7-cyano-7-deazaguanine reductase
MTEFNEDVRLHLGRSTSYVSHYDKSLLVRELRQTNRSTLGIFADNLPFIGYDVWNHYEVSALTDTGLPVVFIGKMVYPCESPYIVESKSLKLYFGSFNNTRLGTTGEEVRLNLVQTIEKDLGELLETRVDLGLFDPVPFTDPFSFSLTKNSSMEDHCPQTIITNYKNMSLPIEFISSSRPVRVRYYSNLLYSRCKITNQSDTGTVFIEIFGEKLPVEQSLLRFIVSMRDENHFHEEVCEKIYVELWRQLAPEALSVICFYNRRGSIDINPARVSKQGLSIPVGFADANVRFCKLPRQ